MPGTPIHVRLRVTERRTKAIRLRSAGHTWQEIADRLGYRHRGHACQDVWRALDEHNRARRAAAERGRELRARLDPIIREAWAPIAAADPLDLVDADPLGFYRALAILGRCAAVTADHPPVPATAGNP